VVEWKCFLENVFGCIILFYVLKTYYAEIFFTIYIIYLYVLVCHKNIFRMYMGTRGPDVEYSIPGPTVQL